MVLCSIEQTQTVLDLSCMLSQTQVTQTILSSVDPLVDMWYTTTAPPWHGAQDFKGLPR